MANHAVLAFERQGLWVEAFDERVYVSMVIVIL